MKLEFHQLDRRYEHLRARYPERRQRLLASLAAGGQQTPIVVVVDSEHADRYRVIDGFKRVAALETLGRDTVDAIVWDMSEADALVLEQSLRLSERETALEQGWLLEELEQRFGYSLQDLARRFDRSPSWVSRRLALVEQVPETVQQRVRRGEISAHVAMKCLAPVARVSRNDCERMADVLARHRFSSRQAGALYSAWRDASAPVRRRILDSPDLFLKAHQQLSPPATSAADELLRDLTMVLAITNRAGRRLARAAPLMASAEFAAAERKIAAAVQDLDNLAERIEKEHAYAEPKPTDHDSGTRGPGGVETRDCPNSETVSTERASGAALEVHGVAGPGASGESRSLPQPDPGTTGLAQRQSRPGP